jgi:multiple sugar transport system permease protein
MTTSTDSSAGQLLDAAERLVSKPQRSVCPLFVGDALTYLAVERRRVDHGDALCLDDPDQPQAGAELVAVFLSAANPTLANYVEVLGANDFGRWYFNSLLIAAISTGSVAFFDSLVGYTLNKFDFPGKTIIFIGMLATLMVPTEMLIIPWFNMSVQAGWNQGPAQYWGIVFPGVITAVGIFLMRQFFDSVPNELLDAARIDGMNEFGIFWRIAVPLVKPAIAALCIFNFIGNWNAYLWPLIIASSREFYTLPVGLSFFRGETSTEWEKIMTGASLATVPLLIVFLALPASDHQGDRADGTEGIKTDDNLSAPKLQPSRAAARLSPTPRRSSLRADAGRRTRRTPSCWRSAASSAGQRRSHHARRGERCADGGRTPTPISRESKICSFASRRASSSWRAPMTAATCNWRAAATTWATR